MSNFPNTAFPVTHDLIEPETKAVQLDAIDENIIHHLQQNARISMTELRRRCIYPLPCNRRVKRLEDMGIITGYHARLNMEKLLSARFIHCGQHGQTHR